MRRGPRGRDFGREAPILSFPRVLSATTASSALTTSVYFPSHGAYVTGSAVVYLISSIAKAELTS